MSWGYRITILVVGFVCFMTFMVIAAFQQDFDLVTEDYYGRELQFQSQINKQINQQQLSLPVVCKQENDQLIIQFPEELLDKKIDGEIVLYRPSNASKDFIVKLNPAVGKQSIDKKILLKGLYEIQITYTCDDKAYYFDEDLMIN